MYSVPGFDHGLYVEPSSHSMAAGVLLSHQPGLLASAGRCALRSAPGEAFPVGRTAEKCVHKEYKIRMAIKRY